MSKLNLEWDGEKIKQVITQEEKKHTPKDILNSLNQVRGQINQMQTQRENLEKQMKTNEHNLADAKEFEKSLKEFEAKCTELQIAKLKALIKELHEECMKKAEEDAVKICNKDPNAYTDQQKKMLPYLNYQKLLATNEKVADKISSVIISKYLYDEPVFDNPFN